MPVDQRICRSWSSTSRSISTGSALHDPPTWVVSAVAPDHHGANIRKKRHAKRRGRAAASARGRISPHMKKPRGHIVRRGADAEAREIDALDRGLPKLLEIGLREQTSPRSRRADLGHHHQGIELATRIRFRQPKEPTEVIQSLAEERRLEIALRVLRQPGESDIVAELSSQDESQDQKTRIRQRPDLTLRIAPPDSVDRGPIESLGQLPILREHVNRHRQAGRCTCPWT